MSLGGRITKKTGGQLANGYWDGDGLLADVLIKRDERNESAPLLLREWVYYPETLEPLALIQSLCGPQAPPLQRLTKGLFTSITTTLTAVPLDCFDPMGQMVWAALYGAWGLVEHLSINRTDNPLRLQGQYYDEETGLHYNRYRYYSPREGAFIQQDPIGLRGGINLYRYAPNPWAWIDPFGTNRKGNMPSASGRLRRLVVMRQHPLFKLLEEIPEKEGKRGLDVFLDRLTEDIII